MRKILFFIESLEGGGAEKVLCNLVNAMDQTRFDITVQTLWKTDAARFLKPGIRYRYCYAAKNRFNSFRSRLEAADGLTYPLHIKGHYAIEVAYLEFGSTKIMAASTNRKALKLAWVHCDLMKKLSDPAAFVEKAGDWYRSFDRVICVSQTARHSFVSLFGMEDKTAVLYNTVNDAEIREKSLQAGTLPLEKRRFTVLSVGRLSEEKQFGRLLSVHRRLLEAGLPHDLWILGEGDQRPVLEVYIAENGLSDSVRLPGFCSNPYPYMAQADLLVCSSRYEGFSTFITEGLILGRPIVTTDCSGMQELLGDSQYGLITENSEEGLYKGLKDLLANPERLGDYALAAKARGSAFSTGTLVKKTESFLEDSLRARASEQE